MVMNDDTTNNPENGPQTEEIGKITTEQMQAFLKMQKDVQQHPDTPQDLSYGDEDLSMTGGKRETGELQVPLSAIPKLQNDRIVFPPPETALQKLMRTVKSTQSFRSR